MNAFTMKTYKDSYLYKNKTRKLNSDENKNNKALSEFIMQSTRIDKNSNAFVGIIEDIKRQQTSSIVYTILLLDKVQLCIGNYELPRSFKVFEAYDIRFDKTPKVFIDVTGLIEYRNGYYICKKVDVLVAYIYNALTYLLYRYAPTRLMNNTEIIQSATKCYSSLFCYIIDYLRIIGYSENRNKVNYLASLFFLSNHMDKELDQYSKNVAAKIADISLREIGPYDLYIDEIDFTDINTFIMSLSKLFSLKGLNTEVMISKWVYLFGTGTQYSSELFTNFSILLTSAYSGAYIVNQKQIERSCGVEMVKYNNAFKRIGVETFEHGGFRESSIDVKGNDTELAEAIKERSNSVPKYTGKEFGSLEETIKLADALKKYYVDTKQTEKMPKEVIKVIKQAVTIQESYVSNHDSNIYEEGTILKFAKVYKNIFNGDELRKVEQLIDDHIRIYQGIAEDTEVKEDKQKAARCIKELREVKQYL